MAAILFYNCNSCNFRAEIFLRGEIETQLIEPKGGVKTNSLFCLTCLKNVDVPISEKTCPNCSRQDFINGEESADENISCPMCKAGLLEVENGPVF